MTDVRRRAAGWYDDEADAAVLRYWDGASWTPHVTPRPHDEPAAQALGIAAAMGTGVLNPGSASIALVDVPAALPAAPAAPVSGVLPAPPRAGGIDESTAVRPAPAAAIAATPPPASQVTPAPAAAITGLPSMTSRMTHSSEFVSDTLRAPSFAPPPMLHAPNEHTTVPQLPAGVRGAASAQATDVATGDRSYLLTWLFALLLGSLGVDRFYLGKARTAVVKLVTLGGFGVWTIIDLVLVLTGVQRDRDGLALTGYEEHRRLSWIVSGALVAFGVLAVIVASVVVASLAANLGAAGGLG
jgi:TM2 domain-containing membrane protein YozV